MCRIVVFVIFVVFCCIYRISLFFAVLAVFCRILPYFAVIAVVLRPAPIPNANYITTDVFDKTADIA